MLKGTATLTAQDEWIDHVIPGIDKGHHCTKIYLKKKILQIFASFQFEKFAKLIALSVFVLGALKVWSTPSGGFLKNAATEFQILASWFH